MFDVNLLNEIYLYIKEENLIKIYKSREKITL